MSNIGLFISLSILGACADKSDSSAYVDADGDGYTTETDCNDNNPNVYPDAEEFCDGADQDCDGEADNGISRNFYVDFDLDGFGNPSQWIVACEETPGFVDNYLDCDDTDPFIHPMAPDICDNIDNNCNGVLDEEASITFYFDWDGDGFGLWYKHLQKGLFDIAQTVNGKLVIERRQLLLILEGIEPLKVRTNLALK